jgi:ssDNA-specific exonuclease RecJ
MNNIDYFFARLIRFSILFFILYLIFTNFGTFLIVVSVLALLVFFFIYSKIKKIKEQAKTQGFEFHFDGRNFRQGTNQGFKFNYEDFQKGNFQAQPSINEVQKAKDFFGFTHEPTREEIKRKYKELAKKYHPDINNNGDELMQELNHHKDVLLNSYK